MKKLWAGRIQTDTNVLVNEFNESLSVDYRLYKQDIEGSMAHATMLGACQIISADDTTEILKGLKSILDDIDAGAIELDPELEDIHMNIESLLIERIGEPGRRLHTARSRNDQTLVDMRLYTMQETKAIKQLTVNFIEVLLNLADKHLHTIMPGYTHLQRAQPVTLAHYLMAYAEMFSRDIERLNDCFKRMDSCPLGAGALAATTYPIDREMTAKELGFSKITPNSLDAIGDRDFCIELLSALSIMMMHLSRMSEEVIFWCSWECAFAETDEAFSTGSSIMPQKKNPDVAELVRGKSGRVFGDLMAVLTVMKGLPLAYNKDMQEDKESVFDAIDTVKQCLSVFAPMIETMTFKTDNMRKAAAKGFLNATDCADYLVKKGLPFRDAYGVVGQLVRSCIEKDCTLESLSLNDYQSVCHTFDTDVYEFISLENCVNARKVPGGPAPEAVKVHIADMRQRLLSY